MNQEIIVPAFEMIGENKQARQIRDCGDVINVIRCIECDTKYFGGFLGCRSRWCLNCMRKRMICWIAKLTPIFQQWLQDGNYLSLLNFTVRDGDNLNEVLEFLENSFRKMYNSDKKRRDYWLERFPGGIRSLEVKIGKDSNQWHPHYHCLVMQKVGEYVKDYDWLSEDWHKIVGFKELKVRLLCDGTEWLLADPARRKDGTPDYNYNGNEQLEYI